MSHRVTAFVGALTATAAMLLAEPPQAAADVSAACLAHLAEHPGTTPAADRRFHLQRGEESPCSAADAADGYASSSEKRKDDEGKSRYCRKRWWC